MAEQQKSSGPGTMGFWSATSIGVGAMIGAGIFALVGIAVDIAGNLAWLAFLNAGLIALLTTYSVSRLAVTYPSKGGRVEYINVAYGRGIFAGSLNVGMWIGYIIVTSLYARAFGEYFLAMIGAGENKLLLHVAISAIVILFAGINFIGSELVGKLEVVIVAVKVVVLLLFGLAGLFTVQPEKLAFEFEGTIQLWHVILASGVVFMSYEGFGLVANTAEDLNNPQKTLTKALFTSVLIVMAVYLLVTFTVVGNLSVGRILEAKEYVLAEAAKPTFGNLGFSIMAIAALFSTASAINATIYGPVNMLEETARARQVPPVLVRRLFGNEVGTSLLITGIVLLLTSNLLDLEAIAETGSLIFLIIYTAVNVANLKLHDQTGSKRLPVVLAALGTLASFGILYYYLWREGNLSAYLLLVVAVAVVAFQVVYQKVFRKPLDEESP